MDEKYKDMIPKSDSWLKKRRNGLYLTDYQVSVLKRNGISINNSINAILMEINDILLEEENDELEQIAKELDEMNYYNSKKN